MGGRLVETIEEGADAVWGTVEDWQPGERVRFSWHPGRDSASAQWVEVTFARNPPGTRVTLTHGGWERLGERAAEARSNYTGGWQFVFWGLLHGSALTVNHAFRGAGIRVGKVLGWIVTTVVVLAGWVLFRSASMTQALATFGRLFHGSQRWLDPGQMELFRALPYLGIAAIIAYGFPNTATLSERFRPSVRWTSFSMALLALAMFCILGEFEPPEFLYFDF